ncbi:MAG: tetratricopeptide repeat protein [Planctomycetota bacterium]|jgi:Flp pilus assembly protein TadD
MRRVHERGRIRIGLMLLAMAGGGLPIGCGGGEGGSGGDPETTPRSSPADPGATGQPRIDEAGYAAALDAAAERLDTGDREAAEAILATAIRRRPEDPRARELLGRVAMGRATDAAAAGASAERVRALHREAWEQYRVAADARPEDAVLQASAGLVALSAGDAESALRLLDRAIELDPSRPQPMLFAGQIRLERGRYAEAARDFEAVLALDPREPYAMASMAMVRLAEDRPDEAVALVAEARRIAPDDAALRVQEVRVLRRAGRAEEAIARMLAVPREQRQAWGMTPELAASLREQGRMREAAEAWAALWPEATSAGQRAEAAIAAAEAWADAGAIEEAWRWVARARDEGPAADAASIERVEARLREAAGG